MSVRGGGRSFSVEVKGNWSKALRDYKAYAAHAYIIHLDRFVVALNDNLLSNTPVWEGTTVRNWHWALGSASGKFDHAEGGDLWPGRTNTMPLGPEPRRPANESAEENEFETFRGRLRALKKPVNIYLTNTSPSAVSLEYGMLPTPATARRKKGMLLLSIVETLAAMGVR